MPQVPRYDNPTIQTTPQQTPYAQQVSPDALGAGMIQGAGRLAESIAAVAVQARHQADQKFLNDAMTAADTIDSAQLYGDDNIYGYLQLRGMDAVDRSTACLDDAREQYDKLGETAANDRQRQLFDRLREHRMASLQRHVLTHSSAQWLQAGDESRAMAMKSTLNKIGTGWNDDQAFDDNVEKLNLLVDQEADARGLPPDAGETATYKADRKKEIFARAFGARVNRMMAADPRRAGNFLQQHRDELDSAAVGRYERQIRPKLIAVESRAQSDRIWGELGPRDDHDPVAIERMLEEARRRIADPETRTAALNDLQQRFATRREGEKQRREANEAAIAVAHAAGGSLADILAMPEFSGLPDAAQQKVRERIIAFGNGLVRKGKARNLPLDEGIGL